VIHAIVLGFGFSIGVFLWHFVVGFYAARAEQRRYRRGMELLYPKLTPVQPAPVQSLPAPRPPRPAPAVVPYNTGGRWAWVFGGAVVALLGVCAVAAVSPPHNSPAPPAVALSGD
jgi:hypothetical protein